MGAVDPDRYRERFQQYQASTLYPLLDAETRHFLRQLAYDYRFTFQELRQVVTASRDLAMWGETPLSRWWTGQEAEVSLTGRPRKKELLRRLHEHLHALRSRPTRYPPEDLAPPGRKPLAVKASKTDRRLLGVCPAYSSQTVCCGLQTLDVVSGCVLGCSYCTIQSFYTEQVVIQQDLATRLAAIELSPGRLHHVGTGQSSDSLVWGNREGLLDALFEFAAGRPNLVLELKTKSSNVGHLLGGGVPPNVVASWSLNTPTIIAHEEHYTAPLEARLEAAEQVASRGLPVAFHLHPLVHYRGWERDYAELALELQRRFTPEQIWFVSLGTVTFIKPALKALRRGGLHTLITQMEMEPDPMGKLTYPTAIKEKLYRHLYQAFASWHDRVFFYLCMEPAPVWRASLGWDYPDGATFQAAFERHLERRLSSEPAPGRSTSARSDL